MTAPDIGHNYYETDEDYEGVSGSDDDGKSALYDNLSPDDSQDSFDDSMYDDDDGMLGDEQKSTEFYYELHQQQSEYDDAEDEGMIDSNDDNDSVVSEHPFDNMGADVGSDDVVSLSNILPAGIKRRHQTY